MCASLKLALEFIHLFVEANKDLQFVVIIQADINF